MLMALLELSAIIGLLTLYTDGQINVVSPAERKQQQQKCDIKVSLDKCQYIKVNCASRCNINKTQEGE